MRNPRIKIKKTSIVKGGFTLIELSIVLVIIGLIIGGVLVGQDLINAARVRSQISQVEEVKATINTFKTKYGYLPGDMPPTQTSQLSFFTFTGTYAGKSCTNSGNQYAYGDNNGFINSGEQYAFWSHLSDAQLVNGNYGGTAGNLLNSSVAACSYNNGQPTITPTASEMFKFAPPTKINPSIGSVYGWRTGINISSAYGYLLSASEAYQIDSKVDDGLPYSGNVTSNISGFPPKPCITFSEPLIYDLSPATANVKNCPYLSFSNAF